MEFPLYPLTVKMVIQHLAGGGVAQLTWSLELDDDGGGAARLLTHLFPSP